MDNKYTYLVKYENQAHASISNTCQKFTVESTRKITLQEIGILLRKTNEHLSFTNPYRASKNFFHRVHSYPFNILCKNLSIIWERHTSPDYYKAYSLSEDGSHLSSIHVGFLSTHFYNEVDLLGNLLKVSLRFLLQSSSAFCYHTFSHLFFIVELLYIENYGI